MIHSLAFDLSAAGVDNAIKAWDEYKAVMDRKCIDLCEKLAFLGATQASLLFSQATYTGDNDVRISVDEAPGGFVVSAEGEAALFIEFGSGVRYGYGHPEAGKHGMGPGTYPDGKGHWDDDSGWYLPKDKGGSHTFGNPPSAAMYQATKAVKREILRAVREVFG